MYFIVFNLCNVNITTKINLLLHNKNTNGYKYVTITNGTYCNSTETQATNTNLRLKMPIINSPVHISLNRPVTHSVSNVYTV